MEKGYNKNSFAQKYRPSYNVQRHPRYFIFKNFYGVMQTLKITIFLKSLLSFMVKKFQLAI